MLYVIFGFKFDIQFLKYVKDVVKTNRKLTRGKWSPWKGL